MPQLLLELLSEEIPARMQANAARDLERMARERLLAEGLLPEALKTFGGARRLTLVAEGLPERQPDRHEELKGPKTSAPDQALEGFLRKTGLSKDQLVEKDGVWFATVHRHGRATAEIVAEMVQGIVRDFPWPKSMVSGVSKLRWVRPLRRIVCVFDGEIVPFQIEGIPSGDVTQGHRFMGSAQPFRVKDFDDYAEKLQKHHVVLDPEERKAKILEEARTLCFARNLELVDDAGLLDEVAGLVEWPVPVLGDMDPAFLDLPPEVIRTSMRVHQRYFAVRNPATGKLAPHFVTIANIAAKDGGRTIATGNAKVLSARLSDARFFWNEDRKVRLEDRLEKLKGVTFHAKLGSMYDRVQRIVSMAEAIAPFVRDDDATRSKAAEAASLCKADLVSGVVGEFPELQGIMGGYYAEAEGLDPEVVDAIRHHYKPQGPNDDVPVQSVAATVALADKLDTLVSFFGIGEKPTGSRDPFALRRAALGVIRIVLSTRTRLPLKQFGSDDLLAFFADRLKVQLRDEGQRHDLVDAAFALGDDDLVRIVARVQALGEFLATDDGANLLAGYKRAVNILRAEEKKGPLPTGVAAAMTGQPAEEAALIAARDAAGASLSAALGNEDFVGAMQALAALRGPVDAFFDKVLVNSDVEAERENRLRLLANVRDLMGQVADFSQVTG
ncbi:glycine--tRNA ligase subunit beta [Phenylobacterium kunshanense]|uniref:Glycine--tRNA ligase beta subunit n=1 Tax=Phenylobacterium kunshanense TaxID=1445034 RepID=A0A328BM88_9CAUL|nr:glycine--tRNA ligase subunit beta [Phenylobacterium kunshanense]RAK68510.1 glycine--tRNA ligase subunit beta [Phenylobacterium kunshanense]